MLWGRRGCGGVCRAGWTGRVGGSVPGEALVQLGTPVLEEGELGGDPGESFSPLCFSGKVPLTFFPSHPSNGVPRGGGNEGRRVGAAAVGGLCRPGGRDAATVRVGPWSPRQRHGPVAPLGLVLANCGLSSLCLRTPKHGVGSRVLRVPWWRLSSPFCSG